MTKRILVDMDGILADLGVVWRRIYNEEYGENLKLEDIKDWDYHGVIPPERLDAFHAIIDRPGVFRSLPVIDGAKNGMDRLHDLCLDTKGTEDECEVFICTAATAAAHTPTEKILWLEEHFPWIDRKHIICCHAKYLIKANVLIDDSTKNARLYRKAWPDALIYGLAYPHNEDFTKYGNRVKGPAPAAWREITDDIEYRLVTMPRMMLR